jgi:cation-transporting P-type ATPase 13A2
VTIAAATVFSLYMILYPSHGVTKTMQLTGMAWDFKGTLIALGAAYLAVAWVGEKHVFQPMARFIGTAKVAITKRTKKRKEYKVIQEQMMK